MMQQRRAGRRFARAGATVALAFVFLGAGATAAFAHATLKNTSPPQSAVFKSGAGPHLVVLGFDENVSASPTFLKVYDGAGRAVPGVHATAQNTAIPQATLPLLPDGTFVTVWHIISADGHPEQGAFTFTVGKGGAATADINGLLAQDRASRGLGIGFGIDRALAFLGCLLFVGGLVFVRFAWPEVLSTRRVRLLLALSAYVAIAASLLSIPLEAAYSNASTSKLFDGSALSDVVHAHFGTGALWRAAILLLMLPAIVAVAERGWSLLARLTEVAVVALALGVWATFAYAGHGDTGRLVPLGFATDVAHLGAASLWLGGLAALVVALRGAADTDDAARTAVRFSAVALPAIAVVVLSGVTQSWRQLGSWDALWHTTYGRLLIVKFGVVVGIVVIASAARDIVRDQLVPAVRGALRPASLSAAAARRRRGRARAPQRHVDRGAAGGRGARSHLGARVHRARARSRSRFGAARGAHGPHDDVDGSLRLRRRGAAGDPRAEHDRDHAHQPDRSADHAGRRDRDDDRRGRAEGRPGAVHGATGRPVRRERVVVGRALPSCVQTRATARTPTTRRSPCTSAADGQTEVDALYPLLHRLEQDRLVAARRDVVDGRVLRRSR